MTGSQEPRHDMTASRGSVVVLDVGKTLAKATLWSPARRMIEKRSRLNERIVEDGLPRLDHRGIEHWLTEMLKEFAAKAEIDAIIPVAHGAAACLVDDDGLALTPLDYEATLPEAIRRDYEALRDEFGVTGSPCLPGGLNLGAQLFWLQTVKPDAFARGRIVTWPQYWAWRLSGVEATEVTSLGCHSDLWLPAAKRPSPMAVRLGWDKKLAPLHKASDVLGTVAESWRSSTGLPCHCRILCGIHDSNAALLAYRLHPEIGNRDCTVLSTGTWFIAMRSLSGAGENPRLAEQRDCLFNVDVAGNPVPSSRFMGGREAELIEAGEGSFVDVAGSADELLRLAKRIVDDGVFALPTFETGFGPYPRAVASWIGRPDDKMVRRAVAGLYLALMADCSLALIGAKGRCIIEGRFGSDPVFTQALASLRPGDSIFVSNALDNLAYGALGLVDGAVPAASEMTKVDRLDFDIAEYAERWRELAQGAEGVPSLKITREKRK